MGRVLSSLAGCGKLTAVALLALLTVMLMGLPLKLDLRSARDGAALRRWVRQHEGRDVEIPSNLLIGLATGGLPPALVHRLHPVRGSHPSRRAREVSGRTCRLSKGSAGGECSDEAISSIEGMMRHPEGFSA